MFEFATAGRIVFGGGTLKEVGPATASFGRRALVVTGHDPNRAAALLESLKRANVEGSTFSVAGEPTTQTVREGVQQAKQAGCDVVIGFGGGSAIDSAKAIAALATNGGDLLD